MASMYHCICSPGLGVGAASITVRTADISRSGPVGRPSSSTTMYDPSGKSREPVTPATRSASALAYAVCMSSAWISIGP